MSTQKIRSRAGVCRLVAAVTALGIGAACGGKVEENALAQAPNDGGVADASILKHDAVAENASVSKDSAAKPALVLFVTQGRWRGWEVGGLAGADAKCNAEAPVGAGPFLALLSDSKTSARDRMPASHRLLNASGAQILDESSDFFPLRNYRQHGILVDLDADGNPVEGLNPNELAWWGSSEQGDSTCNQCCGDWAQQLDMESAAAFDPETGGMVWPGCVGGNPARIVCVGPKTTS